MGPEGDMLISLAKYLRESLRSETRRDRAEASENAGAAIEAVQVLMEGLETGSVRGAMADQREFQERMRLLPDRLREARSVFDVLEVATEARDAFEDYSQRTNPFVRSQSAELQSMIAMLSETIASVSACSQAALDPLHTFTKRIEQATLSQDLGPVKKELAEALQGLREHAARVRERTSEVTTNLERRLQEPQARVAAHAGSMSHAGEWDIPQDDSTPSTPVKRRFAAVLLVEHLLAITHRDGEQVRNRLLLEIGRKLKARLRPGDRLLRWKSGTFVLIMEREAASLAEVRSEVRSATDVGSDIYIDTGSRSILMPVSFSTQFSI